MFEVKVSDTEVLRAEPHDDHAKYVDRDYLDKGIQRTICFMVRLYKDGKRVETPNPLYPGHKGTLDRIGHFYFSPMPGCCGVVVSNNTFLQPSYRRSIYSQPFRDLKELAAKSLGYSCMIATGVSEDVASHKNLLKSNYKLVSQFYNNRTGNKLDVAVKVL